MRATKAFGLEAIIALGAFSTALATERHVPGQYTTIGAAIFASSNGDVVIVAPGTYTGTNNRDISFMGKAITVRSIDPDDPAVVAATIIDCQATDSNQHRGFWFHSNEGQDSVLAGLTITNGWISRGAGILCEGGASPQIRKCILTGNHATSAGSSGGGGIAVYEGNTTIVECRFVFNSADYVGGAIYFTSVSAGAGIRDCIIAENSAGFGGGINIEGGGGTTVERCTIVQNDALSGTGGGVYSGVALEIANCNISTNYAAGGAGVAAGGPLVITNCTLSNNVAVGVNSFGGAILKSGSVQAWLYNSILRENSAPNGPEICLLSNATMLVEHCDVDGGEARTFVSFNSVLLWGAGNIDADPLFVDADGPDNDPATWQDNDYRLAAGSPCIDAADNAAVPADTFDLDGDGNTTEPTPYDLDGNPRFVDDPATADTGAGTAPIVDMGAYEFQVATVCLPCDLNCDGSVNQFDIQPFVELLIPPAPATCSPCAGDTDGNGTVNAFDINAFLDCLIP